MEQEQPQQQPPEQNCIFCQIAQGKIQSKKIYEDEYVMGFLDINPANPGHILLIPKQHYSIMMQIPSDKISYLFNVAQALSNALLKALDVEGTTIYTANGAAAGQKAPHFMIHIIPRKENDELKFTVSKAEINKDSLEKLRQSLVPLINETFGLNQTQNKSTDTQEQKTRSQEIQEGKKTNENSSLDNISKLFK
ncbi:MAG: HIT family protein [Nanobdellota archaeon]